MKSIGQKDKNGDTIHINDVVRFKKSNMWRFVIGKVICKDDGRYYIGDRPIDKIGEPLNKISEIIGRSEE